MNSKKVAQFFTQRVPNYVNHFIPTKHFEEDIFLLHVHLPLTRTQIHSLNK